MGEFLRSKEPKTPAIHIAAAFQASPRCPAHYAELRDSTIA